MYPNYFGLKEASFSITPDPRYLFLSEQHREALAHLLYGAGENGGFVLLTGEVGTGKTTICRAFLEQLPANVDVALVLNPAMTAIELMHAICDEFGVEAPPGETSVKGLVDRLNRFLLEAHAQGRHPVLMIDEAQNLRPKVLEQVRLLTNLETSKHKLLQIFLVGQPELRAMLGTPDLRQLNQRITARFHLQALRPRETVAYVEHRIAIAGVERPLFTGAALRAVHRYSGGVPRLINLICDRSLLGAAVSRKLQVTPRIVQRAAVEVRGSDEPLARRRSGAPALAALVLLGAVGGAWLGHSGLVDRAANELWLAWQPLAEAPIAADEGAPDADEAKPDDDPVEPEIAEEVPPEQPPVVADSDPPASPEPEPAVVAEEALPVEEPPAAPPEGEVSGRISLARTILDLPEAGVNDLDRLTVLPSAAVPELLHRWGQEQEAAGVDCSDLGAFGLACERGSGRWNELRLFDRPVAIEIFVEGRPRHAVLGGLDDEYAILHRGDEAVRVPIAILDEYWSGDFLLLWRPPPSGISVIGAGASGDSVHWLRARLATLPEAEIPAQGPELWNAALGQAVRRFQADHGLIADGIAGPRTLILLSNALAEADVPRLSAAADRRLSEATP